MRRRAVSDLLVKVNISGRWCKRNIKFFHLNIVPCTNTMGHQRPCMYLYFVLFLKLFNLKNSKTYKPALSHQNNRIKTLHIKRVKAAGIEIAKSLRRVKQARFLLALPGGCRYTCAHGLERPFYGAI